MTTLTFVGAGMMASALAVPACDNGHEIRIVGTHLDDEIVKRAKEDGYHLNMKRQLPDGFKWYYYDELEEGLDGTDAVICGVSSFGVDWFLEEIYPKLDPKLPVLSVTKGMINKEDGSLLSYPEYWEEELVKKGIKRDICAVGGPCTSYELADRHHSLVGFCGKNIDDLKFFRDTFANDYYHVSISNDVRAVELSVALKNAYALAVSLAVGIAETEEGKEGVNHYNPQAALFAQSTREMGGLLELVNGDKNQLELGVGDLYVTIFGGRTRKIGTLLGRGYSYDKAMEELAGVTLESVVIAKRMGEAITVLAENGKVDKDKFPLLMHIYDMIANGAKLNIPWAKFDQEDLNN